MRRNGTKIISETLKIQASASAPHACTKNSLNTIKSRLCCSSKKESRKKSHATTEYRHHALYDGDGHRKIRNKSSTSDKSYDQRECKHTVQKQNITKSDRKIGGSNGCARTRIFLAFKKSSISGQSLRFVESTRKLIPSEINDTKHDLKSITIDKKLQTSCPRSDDKNKTRTVSHRCKKRTRLQKDNEQALCCAMTRYMKRILLTTKKNSCDGSHKPKIILDEKKESFRLNNKVASSPNQLSKTNGYDSSNESANRRRTKSNMGREITTQRERYMRYALGDAKQTTSFGSFESDIRTEYKTQHSLQTQTVSKATQTVDTLTAQISTQTTAEGHGLESCSRTALFYPSKALQMMEKIIKIEDQYQSKQLTSIDQLLLFWNHSELIPKFKDEHIDLETLKLLSCDDLKRIIPKLGPRKLFMSKVDSWKQSGIPCSLIVFGDNTCLGQSLEDLQSPDQQPPKSAIVSNQITLGGTVQIGAATETLPHLSVEIESQNLSEKETISLPEPTTHASHINGVSALKGKCNRIVNNSIIEYLRPVRGQKLMAKYDAGKFEDRDRQELSELIVFGELDCNPHKTISPERFIDLATQTCEIFVGEIEFLYYIPRRLINHGVVAPKGKLYNTYRNCVKELASLGLRKSNRRPLAEDEPEEVPVIGTVAEDLMWLYTRVEPWTTVCEKWSKTSATRLSQLRIVTHQKKKKKNGNDQSVGISPYISKFPSLKLPNGYTLLELDFGQLYIGCELKLAMGWEKFAKDVCTLKNIEYTKDLAYVEIFHAFASLFDPQTLRGKGGKKRSTKAEIVEGFLLHIKDIDELDSTIIRMREKATEFKQTVKPFAVSVGLTPSSITDSYVIIEDLKYSVESPLRAVDVTFKSYHALHACYPVQSEGPWLLLQKAVYGINTPWDNQIPRVFSLMRHFRD